MGQSVSDEIGAVCGMSAATANHEYTEGYRHEAFFYAGSAEFMDGALPFIREALASAEPILVVLDVAKIGALRHALGGEREQVHFADMAEVGANPARILPAWEDFVAEHFLPGRRLWGIGEPIWAARTSAELAECQRHEALLNIVFEDAALSLLCPYDTVSLAPRVIAEARRSHPYLLEGDLPVQSADYPGAEFLATPFDEPLPDPPPGLPVLSFQPGALREVRDLVGAHAARAGLSPGRTADLLLAVNEVATNSLMHGGGQGTVCLWRESDALICEVRDRGRIEDPLVGRRRPASDAPEGRGLWLANQLCELVQVRTFPDGGAVRLHMRLAGGSGAGRSETNRAGPVYDRFKMFYVVRTGNEYVAKRGAPGCGGRNRTTRTGPGTGAPAKANTPAAPFRSAATTRISTRSPCGAGATAAGSTWTAPAGSPKTAPTRSPTTTAATRSRWATAWRSSPASPPSGPRSASPTWPACSA
jgi:anti-sigma regulatory factor (Ser/Thr protein kinase)